MGFYTLYFTFYSFQKNISKENLVSKINVKTPLENTFNWGFCQKGKNRSIYTSNHIIKGAKIPLLNGIQLTKNMVDFYPLESTLEKVEYDILQGKSLHQSMDSHNIFDKKMVSLIKVAEETNQNETIFKRLTAQYNEEIEYKSKMISAIIEPFIILILGAIVAVILIAMYLPMFKLSTVIS